MKNAKNMECEKTMKPDVWKHTRRPTSLLMGSVKKVSEGNKGDPARPLGEKPTKSKENLPEAPLGPRHASRCNEDGSTSRLLAESVRKQEGRGKD